MLDAWAVADTEGNLLGTHEGSLEEAHRYAKRFLGPGGTVYLDGMRKVYEGDELGDVPELPVAANITRAQRRAIREGRLLEIAPSQPFDQQPGLAAAALGLDGPIDTDEVLALTPEEAHAEVYDFFQDLPEMRRGVRAKLWETPTGAVSGMLGGNFKMNKADPRQERARAIGVNLSPNKLAYRQGTLRPRQGETVCLRSTNECRATCLVYTGQNTVGQYANALKLAKTKAFLNEPVAFARLLYAAIDVWSCRMVALELVPYVRLNVYADIPWELVWPGLFEEFPGVNFYDYTKVPGRQVDDIDNYDLTFSYSGRNQADTQYEVQVQNRRVATVFLRKEGWPPPETWNGLDVVDGETSDLRPLDPPNAEDPVPVCVGLKYRPPRKGGRVRKAIRGRDIFVVPCELQEQGGEGDDARFVVVPIGQRHTFALGPDAAEPLPGEEDVA